jgi:hypothetical protein
VRAQIRGPAATAHVRIAMRAVIGGAAAIAKAPVYQGISVWHC